MKVLISIFEDEAAADAAVVALAMTRRVAPADVAGDLVLTGLTDVKTRKVGSHSFYKGAGSCLVLAPLGPAGRDPVGVGLSQPPMSTRIAHHKGLALHYNDR